MPSTTADSSPTTVVVTDTQPLLTGTAAASTPQWRFLLADMATGSPITLLDRQARDRTITYERNKSTEITGTVSSDNPSINSLYLDLFPNLAEGDRLLYCFRRDYDGNPASNPPWTPRAAGILLQYDDAATSEDGNSSFTAFDPWQYLYSIPVIAAGASAPLLHDDDVRYATDVFTLDEIVIDLLETAEQWYNGGTAIPRHGVPLTSAWGPTSGPRKMFLDWGWSGSYNGTIETVVGPMDGTFGTIILFQKGMSIGEALDQLVAIGNFDIVMTPIYDPVNRPGILCELSIFNISGAQKPSVQFAWDYSPWSVEEVSRQVDGTGRANRINLHITQGGESVGVLSEMASANRFGEYWQEQFFVGQVHSESLAVWAQSLKDIISEHPRLVSITALPERSPEPFLDYFIGDEVEVLASSNLRATMSGFQRVQAMTLDISDEATETVRDLRVFIPSGVDTQ